MFRVGQKVVAVGYNGHDDIDIPECQPKPVKGRVYTVADTWFDDVDLMIDLVELTNPGDDFHVPGYLAIAFRPVIERKTDISVFQAMLKPAKNAAPAHSLSSAHGEGAAS